MSTLNTRKDRDRNGKAKLHNHSGIPTLTGKWRHPSMDCWVNYSTPGDHEWKRLYTTLRRRADDRRQCHRVMQGDDPEGIRLVPGLLSNKFTTTEQLKTGWCGTDRSVMNG